MTATVSTTAPQATHAHLLGIDNDETCLMTARYFFRIIILLNQVHSMDKEDLEAIATLASLGHEYVCAVEERLFQCDPPTA